MRKISNTIGWTLLLMFMMSTQVQAQTEDWTYMHRGDQLFKQGDFKSAEKCFDHALELDTANVRARFNLADTYLAQGIADSAYAHFQRAAQEGIGKDKRLSSKAFHNMGVITQNTANATQEPDKKQNYLKQAIADYKEALRLNPNADDSRYNMVLCMKQLKENEQQQQDQQQNDKSKQKQEQQQEPKDDKKQQQPKQKDKPEPPKEQKDNTQAKQILNYARQKEQQTKEKVNVLPQKRQRGKNW